VIVGTADIELDEGAGQLLGLPGRGLLAGPKPDDHVSDAQRLSGLHAQIARQAVALVEQADHRFTFGHGRHAAHRLRLRLGRRLRARLRLRPGLGRRGLACRRAGRLGLVVLERECGAPAGETQPDRAQRGEPNALHASGVHAS